VAPTIDADSHATQAARPAHRPSRRSEIVAAAIAEFADTGLASATIADVARRAGMTPAAVYYHFPTREELIVEVVRQIGAKVEADAKRPRDEGLQGTGLFGAIYDDYERWVLEHPGEARILWVDAVGLSPVVEAARRQTVIAIVENTVDLLVGTGFVVDETAAEMTALALVTLTLAAMELKFRTGGPVPSKAQLRKAVEYVGQRLLGGERLGHLPAGDRRGG